jgi:hypothetical protein
MVETDPSGWYNSLFLHYRTETIRFEHGVLRVGDGSFANDIYSIAATEGERERFDAGLRLYIALAAVILITGCPVYTLKVPYPESLKDHGGSTLQLFTLPNLMDTGARQYDFSYTPDVPLILDSISFSHAECFFPIEPAPFVKLDVAQDDEWRYRNEVLKILDRRMAPRSKRVFPETP